MEKIELRAIEPEDLDTLYEIENNIDDHTIKIKEKRSTKILTPDAQGASCRRQ